MNARTRKATIATVATLAGSCALGFAVAYVQRRRKNDRAEWREEMQTWEGEGGNVPAVPTPTPHPNVSTAAVPHPNVV